jgi:predicted MPP superfamily phosphohydrolase
LQVFRPFDFEWNRLDLEFPSLPEDLVGLRIIHLTDLHLRRHWHDAYDRLIEQIAAADADLLLFTGDFVDSKRNHVPALPNVRRMAAAFRARLGAFAVLGNHDTMKFAPRYADLPVTLLSGRHTLLPVGNSGIELIGIPGAVRKELPNDWAATMPPRSAAASPGSADHAERPLRIVLSHFPDHYARVGSTLRPDLFLAGHTHGGQVCLPGGMPIIKHDSLPLRHCVGISRVADTWMVVGRGFGSTTLPLRICCPPEVIEIRLLRQTAT